MKPTDCTCREVLVDHVLRRVSHPYHRCPFYGTFTPLGRTDPPQPPTNNEGTS